MKRILIGIDDSKFADHAAAYGFKLARHLQAAVGLVHIIEPAVIPAVNSAMDPGLGLPVENNELLAADMMNIQDKRSRQILDATIKKYAGELNITVFEEYGSTADGIIECSKEFKADMIVIGTHSRTGLDRFFMGSVAEQVVRHSPIPVLVVPMKNE
jgi:nucleotide-binding universal stress UspA family protein